MSENQQKIVPSLWFDKECEEAMNFYVSAFRGISGEKKESRIVSIQRYEEGINTPGFENMQGKILTGIFELEGYRFIALDGGPMFRFNPALSLMVNFDASKIKDARQKEEQLWARLSEGGKVLMEFKEYPYSKLYGWVEDKYGLSWQLILSGPGDDPRPFIFPSLLFTGDVAGKAEEAMEFYLSVFDKTGTGLVERYPAGMEPDKQGSIMYCDFRLEDQWFVAMDSARMHEMRFNEAISFTVNCNDQEEIDRLWSRLSHIPEAEQCGWLKDKFGVSWQIVPAMLNELLSQPDKEKVHRVFNTLLGMKKLVISELEEAYA